MKDKIRKILIERAKQRKTIFYGELAKLVGMSAQGPWKPILDDIGHEETKLRRPDITYLVVNKKHSMPGQIGYKPANPPTDLQKQRFEEEKSKVFAFYA